MMSPLHTKNLVHLKVYPLFCCHRLAKLCRFRLLARQKLFFISQIKLKLEVPRLSKKFLHLAG